uniref:VWFA domain-containing protein n=1 Tax=Apteryx owenii TaxID=8824 RepID=A0A8B9QCN7_APTOW
ECSKLLWLSLMEADIYFLIDGSGSINPSDFEDMKTFMNEMVGMFQVGASSVRFGVVQYSDKSRTEFMIGQHNQTTRLTEAIRNIDQIGGGTRTGDALRSMKSLFRMAVRQNVPQTLIVITDGKSQDKVNQAAKELRQQEIVIYAIGIKEAVREELAEIAETKDRIFFVNDFDSLKLIKHDIVRAICSENGKRFSSAQLDPFQAPSIIICSYNFDVKSAGEKRFVVLTYSFLLYFLVCKNLRADIVFLVDSSKSIRPAEFQKVKDFMQSFVTKVDVGLDNVRIGLLQFSSEIREEFQLDRYSTMTDLQRAIQEMQQIKTRTLTGKALTFAASYFDRYRGGRPELKQYLIVITDGKSQDPVKIPARAIRDKGITIYAIDMLKANNSQLLEIVANLPAAVRALKEDGINLVAVGVSTTSRAELQEIIGDQERFFFAQSYDSLESIHKNLMQIVCEKSQPGKGDF